MDRLATILEQAMYAYEGKGLNGFSYFMKNDGAQVMSVVAKFTFQGTSHIETSLLARIVGEQIIIDEDKTNKPLVDALLQAGIKRKQIILAYAGESIPETA